MVSNYAYKSQTVFIYESASQRPVWRVHSTGFRCGRSWGIATREFGVDSSLRPPCKKTAASLSPSFGRLHPDRFSSETWRADDTKIGWPLDKNRGGIRPNLRLINCVPKSPIRCWIQLKGHL